MASYTSVNPETNKEKVWGKITPYTNNLYPVFLSANNRGGQVTVSTVNSTTIPDSHKEEGMIAYQESTGRHYKLNGSDRSGMGLPSTRMTLYTKLLNQEPGMSPYIRFVNTLTRTLPQRHLKELGLTDTPSSTLSDSMISRRKQVS